MKCLCCILRVKRASYDLRERLPSRAAPEGSSSSSESAAAAAGASSSTISSGTWVKEISACDSAK